MGKDTTKKKKIKQNSVVKKAISLETFVFLAIFFLIFGLMARKMGTPLMFKTMMATAHDLLLNTVFFIMAMAVIAGAISALLSEFGAIALINKIFAPLMKPLWGMPGASVTGAVATYLSDNPAIIPFAKDKRFTSFFKKYQVPALCNLGTAFGMGLIVTMFMMGQGEGFIKAAIIGNVGAILGSIISVRLMLIETRKYYGDEADEPAIELAEGDDRPDKVRIVRDGNMFQRVLDTVLEGGKTGVEMGLAIIPGVLIVCTFVMMLTFKMPAGGYTGAAYEGVGFLPWLGEKLTFILEPLFGFHSAEAIAFPITALGAVGGAISLVPEFLKSGLIGANDIAVFTAMGMCWSGYLSTHIGMMDALGVRKLSSKAIVSHTIGGLAAGVIAHYLFVLLG
ncbi:CD0519/CD1768 family membrane protein [Gemella taiwanensis]|uniref:CD0519/CD1768 family membrane protein n=1 Tax=Gemella haemolysans TaxID=1379 RepID=UPI003FA0E519